MKVNNYDGLQILLSTMEQSDPDTLLKKMNIASNAVVINQTHNLATRNFGYNGHLIKWYDFPDRGIGLSRNEALLHADHSICLFADDDVVYHTDYAKVVEQTFQSHPEADIVIFNLRSTNPSRPEYVISSWKRIHFFNCLRYGTFRIAVRRESLLKHRIYFTQLFGGCSIYGSGEDSLFLIDCIRSHLSVYASPLEIGTVKHTSSTWFQGYDKKYFYDKGALFCAISPVFAKLLCLQYCFRHRETQTIFSFYEAFHYMCQGIDAYKKRSKNEASPSCQYNHSNL